LIDRLDDREPFSITAGKVLRLCAAHEYKGYVAAHSFTNIFYILRHKYTSKQRKNLLLDLCGFVEVIGIDKQKILKSLNDETFDDIEDYLQYDCADDISADYIVTRDPGGFVNSKIPTVSPKEFLELFKDME
jgi:predicted nucleic acid-binding protein